MAYAAIVQHLIYTSPPCYEAPLACLASNGELTNNVHVAVQIPAYLLISLSEIFASITDLEYATTKTPTSMKSFIMSIFLLQRAFESALGVALSPTAISPKLVWMYSMWILYLVLATLVIANTYLVGLCIATIITAGIFLMTFNKYNATGDEMNMLEDPQEKAVGAGEITAGGGLMHRNALESLDSEDRHASAPSESQKGGAYTA